MIDLEYEELKAQQAREEAQLYVDLGFNKTDCGEIINSKRQSKRSSFSFIHSQDQRTVYVESYAQHDLTLRKWCGFPEPIERDLKKSVKLARKFFESKDNSQILFLPPVLNVSQKTHQRIEYLPVILTMAQLMKLPNGGEHPVKRETLQVAWWQNDLGDPEKHIEETLISLVWNKPFLTQYHT